MNVFAIVSEVLLSVILFWAVYHACILFAGVRDRRRFSAAVGELPKFSLIVPAKNGVVVIGRYLKALLDVDYPKEKMEIIARATFQGNGCFLVRSECLVIISCNFEKSFLVFLSQRLSI